MRSARASGLAKAWWMVAMLLCLLPYAEASGPRYVTGPPFFTGPAGVAVGWKQVNLTYFTDPGDLSASVNHQAADALVAAAANVWNLPVANITIGRGGALGEHVSGLNTYLDASGMVFPADVMSTNAAAIPIAVIYDADGSVTDTLLGAGASLPSGCRQNAVTESVDGFDPTGYILHAVIVVNGRCTGAAPQMQLQLQYQLVRVFGRVLGLAWSQTNDNVFTGATTPTYAQELHWPIMHPIDIVCGGYTYQCLPNPFQLRPDDVASMVLVYPVTQSTAAAGKQGSLAMAVGLVGQVTFPTGQGMAGVNVLVRRQDMGTLVADSWYESSAVTGTTFRRAGVSPLLTAATDAPGSMGTLDQGQLGNFDLAYLPVPNGEYSQNLMVTTEPVNPLYIGEHSVGPYAPGMVAPSGTAPAVPTVFGVYVGGNGTVNVVVPTAAAKCGDGADGTMSMPAQAAVSGWWNGLLCGYGHASYVSADVKPGRTFTVEVTALDEQGLPTTTKAMPVIGVYAPTDGVSDSPSVGAAASAFQGMGTGMTTVQGATGQLSNVRIGIADERGDGRPDFAYQARLFYADSVTPSRIAPAGGQMTISGSGFRTGNAVLINGVAVTVASWTSSVIVVDVPAMAITQANDKIGVDVTVWDRTTGATSTITAALTYDSSSSLPKAMRLISVQQASMYVGDLATTPFAVQIVAADGVTPVVGESVVFSAGTGKVRYAACGEATCAVRTDVNGMASSSVTPTSAGTITLQASDGLLGQSGTFVALSQVGSIEVTSAPSGSVNVGAAAQAAFGVHVSGADGGSLGFHEVSFRVPVGGATFSNCFSAVCTVMTDGGGNVGLWVTPTVVGPVTLEAFIGDVSQRVSFTAASNVDVMQVVSTPSATAYVYEPAGTFTVRLLHADGSNDVYEPVTFSAPAGVIFGACGTNVCTATSNYLGIAGLPVNTSKTGTYTIQASYGTVTQTTSMTVATHTYQLNIVSMPGNNAVTGVVAAAPFKVQVLEDGVTPAAGISVTLTSAVNGATLNVCNAADCTVVSDANGMVSTTVTPLRAGALSLSAGYLNTVATGTFTAAGVQETLRIVAQPAASGAVVGEGQFLEVQLIGPDGLTPVAYRRMTYVVTSGPFAFTSCLVATCEVPTDNSGYAAIAGTAWGAGAVTITVMDEEVTQTIQFMAVAKADVLRLISAPALGGYAGVAEAIPFKVQAFFSDGVTPVSGRNVTVSVMNGQATFAGCAGAASCTLVADATGTVSTLVTPLAAGTITLTAVDGGVSVSASFTAVARPDTMRLVSAPAGASYVGDVAATPLTVQVLAGDGATPVAGKSVVFSATAGTVRFGACGGSTCTLITGADGTASTSVTPLAAGSVSLLAVEGSLVQTASFTAVAKPDQMLLVSVPESTVRVGATTSATLSVKVVQADGSTPVPGISVVFTASSVYGGVVNFGACGRASCTLVTGANGSASTTVTGVASGAVLLVASASAPSGVLTVSTAINVQAAQTTLTTTNGTVYLAEGASTSLLLQVSAMENGTVSAHQPVRWAGSAGISLSATDVLTDSSGYASVQAVLGPLAGGVQASATACAWTSVCVPFYGVGIAAGDLRLVLVSGGGQVLSGGAAASPIVVEVVDLAGHPVVAAAVNVYQTVTAWPGDCPTSGRCPAAPVLLSRVTEVDSGADGTAVITPLINSSSGSATQTEVAISVGTQGFATTTVIHEP